MTPARPQPACAPPVWLAVCLTLLAGLAACGCGEARVSQAQQPVTTAKTPAGKTVVAALEIWPRIVRVQGSLRADERAAVGTKVAGRVDEVPVDIGSVVRRGDLLVRLDARDFELKVQQAKAQLDQPRAALGLNADEDEAKLDREKVPAVVQEVALLAEAKSNLERARSLLPEKAISEEECAKRQAAVEVGEARHRTALNTVQEQLALVGVRRAELALAKQNLEDSAVKAPFDGVVQQRMVAPGTYVQVGQPVVMLVRVDPLRFVAGVPERESMRLRIGQPAEVMVEGETKPIGASVTRISPSLELSNRSLTVEVDLANADRRLRAGLFAETEIVVEPEAKTLAVPATAVNEFAGVEKVWVVGKDGLEGHVVQTGRRDAKRIEILSGIKPGSVILAENMASE